MMRFFFTLMTLALTSTFFAGATEEVIQENSPTKFIKNNVEGMESSSYDAVRPKDASKAAIKSKPKTKPVLSKNGKGVYCNKGTVPVVFRVK